MTDDTQKDSQNLATEGTQELKPCPYIVTHGATSHCALAEVDGKRVQKLVDAAANMMRRIDNPIEGLVRNPFKPELYQSNDDLITALREALAAFEKGV